MLSNLHIPEPHRTFLEVSVQRLKEDERLIGVAAGGSYLSQSLDEHSDLDLVVVVHPDAWPDVMSERVQLAGRIGPLLEAFTGEHVGEPRLLICLYGPPLLHVDLKFVLPDDLKHRVEDPEILWERRHALSRALHHSKAEFPQPDLYWIGRRFWIWVHYVCTKIDRGELFEAIDAITFLRSKVLGPLLLMQSGARPQGVRHLEQRLDKKQLAALKKTLPGYSKNSCLQALQSSIEIYVDLRGKLDPHRTSGYPTEVQAQTLGFVDKLAQKLHVEK